jgi:hypothetical protein
MENIRASLKMPGVSKLKLKINKVKYQNIAEFATKLAKNEYWVSGTDKNSTGKFQWCSANKLFNPSELFWAPGEPSGAGECVFIKKTNSSLKENTLSTANCSEEKSFLCEVRVSGTAGIALQKECSETWNVTTGKIKPFYKSIIAP